jgi:hypothetical protein
MATHQITTPAQSEVELKFENRANSQLKFTPTETSEVMVRKLQALSSILDIGCGESTDEQIVDEYYDDEPRRARFWRP